MKKNVQKSFVALALLLAISVATVFGQGRGYDLSSMDKNTSACADFYQYANGTWLKNTEIPAAYSSWGAFNVLAENNRKAVAKQVRQVGFWIIAAQVGIALALSIPGKAVMGLVGPGFRYVVVLLTEHPLGSGWETCSRSVTAAAAAMHGTLPGI